MPRREGLYDEVRGLDQTLEDLFPIGGLDIQGYASLAGIVGEPIEASFRIRDAMSKRPDVSGGVPSRFFYFDDIRPQISQDLAAQKPQKNDRRDKQGIRPKTSQEVKDHD